MNDHVSNETLAMLKDVMGDGFNELINMYITDSQARINALNSALSLKDCDVVRREAHSLKGSSWNLGAGIMAELSKQVEEKSREEVLEGVDQLIAEIEIEYQEVSVILKGLM